MKYAFVIQHINALGGTERATCAVMNGLARCGSSVHLAELTSRGASAFPLEPGIRITSLFDRKVKIFNSWFRIVLRLARYLRRHEIDALIVVEATHALYGIAAARLAGIRCIVWEHFNFNAMRDRRKRIWGRWLAARWADDVVVLTERDIGLWQAGTRVRTRLTAIPNIAPPLPEEEGETGRENIVLSAGRLTRQKGYDLLLDAWSLVTCDSRSAGWSLVIRGDGEERDALLKQASALERARILPATECLAQAYRQAGLYVCSSRFEGLPMVLLEASAWGLPIVSFDCETGPAEIVHPNVSGLLVPPFDVSALAEALLALMQDSERRMAMGVAGRLRAVDFQSGPVVERWKRLLDPAHDARVETCVLS